ncbi:MAG: DUF5780 domain-containing protein [Acutalibacter sp.]
MNFLVFNVILGEKPSSKAETSSNASQSHSASTLEETTTQPTPTPSPTPLTPAALEEAAAQFPLRITDSNYILGVDTYSHDAFQVTLENTSDQDILDASIILEAWDSNGLPIDLNLGTDYGVIISCAGINLVPQGTFSDTGYQITYYGAANRISYYKAIVWDYTTAQGETVENSYAEDWIAMFEGKKLDLSQETFSSPQAMMDAGALNGTLSALKNIPPSVLNEETYDIGPSYGGTVTPTENGFLFTYDVNLGFAEGNDTLTQGYGNATLLPMVTYGAPLFEELRNTLQTSCGIENPVFSISLVDGEGTVVYSEDITSEIIDTMGTMF